MAKLVVLTLDRDERMTGQYGAVTTSPGSTESTDTHTRMRFPSRTRGFESRHRLQPIFCRSAACEGLVVNGRRRPRATADHNEPRVRRSSLFGDDAHERRTRCPVQNNSATHLRDSGQPSPARWVPTCGSPSRELATARTRVRPRTARSRGPATWLLACALAAALMRSREPNGGIHVIRKPALRRSAVRELGPTSRANSPGSTTRRLLAVTTVQEAAASLRSTVTLSPGAMATCL
jgi:hypothetical protein